SVSNSFYHFTQPLCVFTLFSFTAPSTTESYTLSLHDALPISNSALPQACVTPQIDYLNRRFCRGDEATGRADSGLAQTRDQARSDRESTRLNSSHRTISYAVFCLKKKNNNDGATNHKAYSNLR